jgi:PRTRC genetic system protein A
MHKLDAFLAQSFPILQVPRYGEFSRLDTNGQRLLIAANGIFLELKRDWLYAVQPCAVTAPYVLFPFGTVVPTIEISFGPAPEPLVEDFIDQAREVAPLETAGAIVFNSRDGRFDLRPCHIRSATPDSVDYQVPPSGVGEVLVIDIHSHGDLSSGFSRQDDLDDRSATKIAIVVGRTRSDAPEIKARLCLNGLFVPLTYPALTPHEDGMSELDAGILSVIIGG